MFTFLSYEYEFQGSKHTVKLDTKKVLRLQLGHLYSLVKTLKEGQESETDEVLLETLKITEQELQAQIKSLNKIIIELDEK